jgi:catechol 2,3-dioxygenase-like lactoylglutathione lyase family enzyme
MKVARIAAIRLTCKNVRALLNFYRSAFACQVLQQSAPAAFLLGEQRIELVEGAAPPLVAVPANSTAFQHFAIVVSDMDKAMTALRQQEGWIPISRRGPERLPRASGGVIAFKFRDPEGHPLELLQFPRTATPDIWKSREHIFLGVDHSAITVAQTSRTLAFYEGMGFALDRQQLNRGTEQEQLDGLSGAAVEVSRMNAPGKAPPHLELLCYRTPQEVSTAACGAQSTMSLVMDVEPSPATPRSFVFGGEQVICDPDGHTLVLKRSESPAHQTG